ncbi:MAG: LnmK family bifunctional acyltransferase/decarboxylase, partial [Pseudomonadota bacterium]
MNATIDAQHKTLQKQIQNNDVDRQIDDQVIRVNDHTLVREVTIKPTMCGHNALLIAQIGDWTWDSVSRLCHVNAFTAKDSEGNPTYLSFYYYQLLGTEAFHLHMPSFGDRLQIVSSCFGSGSESVLTLHRISAVDRQLPPTLSTQEVLHERLPACLYVQNFNRWIQRGAAGNTALYTASPEGFQYQLLPEVSQEHSPRLAYDLARRQGAFPLEETYEKTDQWIIHYDVDMARDLNGVGVLYFASYFSIVDTTLAKVWLKVGRDARSFFSRVIKNQRVCFLGNTEAGTRLSIKVCRYVNNSATKKIN